MSNLISYHLKIISGYYELYQRNGVQTSQNCVQVFLGGSAYKFRFGKKDMEDLINWQAKFAWFTSTRGNEMDGDSDSDVALQSEPGKS